MRGRWVIGAALAAPSLVFALWLRQGWGGVFATRVVDDIGLLVFAVFAAVCCALAARRCRGRQRGSWLAMAAGLGAWSLGELIWCCYELVASREAPFPSLADASFLLFPIGAGIALLLFPAGHSSQSRGRLILDGILVAGSLFVVSWVSALGSVYRAGGASRFTFAVSLAYPIADLVIMTMTIIVLARAQTVHRASLGLLGAGIMLMALADSGFVYLAATGAYHSGSLIDLGWLAGFAVLGLAALSSTPHSPGEEDPVQVPTRTRLWLPYLPLLVAGTVGVSHVLPTFNSGPLPAIALILVATLLVRQVIVLTENRRLLLVITRQALSDPLTGLANRALFTDRLDHAVQRQRRELTPLAVLCLDLDHFKQVNDTLGHPAGDELLIRVAERLTGCLRSTDTVARLGGDEFAVLIEDGADNALLVAHNVAEAFTPGFVFEGHPLTVRASIGLATATAEARDVSSETLFKQADLAMYSAKRDRTGDVHIYTPALQAVGPARTTPEPPPAQGRDRRPAYRGLAS